MATNRAKRPQHRQKRQQSGPKLLDAADRRLAHEGPVPAKRETVKAGGKAVEVVRFWIHGRRRKALAE
jgi:hypothetical protein